MTRAYMIPLMFTAALLGTTAALPAAAQERTPPTVAVVRAAPDLAAIEQRLRDRGIPEDRIGISLERIRAAIASGNYPHLERRLYNFLNPDAGADANRRRVLANGDARPVEARPLDRPATAAAPAVARRQ